MDCVDIQIAVLMNWLEYKEQIIWSIGSEVPIEEFFYFFKKLHLLSGPGLQYVS
jgi:hypothetical protein